MSRPKVKKSFHDPYAELINEFNLKGVKYVIIGMAGINYYASRAQDTFATQDYDIFLKPTIGNVKKAFVLLKDSGYSLNTVDEKLEIDDLKNIVSQKKTIVAVDHYGITIELILAVSGFTFTQMEQDARIFNVNQVPIKVGRLAKLLQSKKIAGRDKDKHFLKRFEIMLKAYDS